MRVGINEAGSIGDRTLDHPLAQSSIVAVMHAANRIGCPIDGRGGDENAVMRDLGAVETPKLQFVKAGPKPEVDRLLSAPPEIARPFGEATRNSDTLFGITRSFEKSYWLHGMVS